jgi:type I restriction enzyme S subunit
MSICPWPEVKLGDHVDLLSGFPFKSAGFTSEPDDVPLVKGENVHQGFIDWVNAKRWPRDQIADLEKFWLRAGDVVLAMDRPWIPAGLKQATVRKHNPPALLVQRVSRLRGANGLRSDFLGHLISSSSFTDYITPIVTGVSVPHISGAQIKGFQFRLPPATTQRRIASILSAYDDLIENNTRRIAILEEMARRIYEEWFVRFRFPGHENVRMVESELGLVPDGWTVEPCASAAEFINGYAFKPDDWSENGTPIIKIKELKEGVTPQTPRFQRTLATRYEIKDGDLLFSWSADLDVYLWNGGAGWLNQHLFQVQPREVTKCFMFHALRQVIPEFRAKSAGTTMKHIKRSALDEVRLILPPASLRRAFEAIASPIDDLVLRLERKNRNLRTTRDLLLPKLISGELDVSSMPEPGAVAA